MRRTPSCGSCWALGSPSERPERLQRTSIEPVAGAEGHQRALHLSFGDGAAHISVLFTVFLSKALQLRNRVQQLRDMGGASYDVDKEIRDAKAYEKKRLHRERFKISSP